MQWAMYKSAKKYTKKATCSNLTTITCRIAHKIERILLFPMVYSTSHRKFINMYKKPYYNWKKYTTKRDPSIQCQGGGNRICRHTLVDSAYLETSKNIYGWFLGHLHSCELEACSWVGRVWGDLWAPKGDFLRFGRSRVRRGSLNAQNSRLFDGTLIIVWDSILMKCDHYYYWGNNQGGAHPLFEHIYPPSQSLNTMKLGRSAIWAGGNWFRMGEK